jgi:hypothetical protein
MEGCADPALSPEEEFEAAAAEPGSGSDSRSARDRTEAAEGEDSEELAAAARGKPAEVEGGLGAGLAARASQPAAGAAVLLSYDGSSPRGELGATLMEAATLEYSRSGRLPPVSDRFLACCRGDRAAATRRWQETLAWRDAQGVAALLRSRHGVERFDVIKRCYPQFLLGKSKLGHCVYLEQIAGVDMKTMQAAGVTLENLLTHSVFMQEFIFTYLSPADDSKTITIIDCAGVRATAMPRDALLFIKHSNALFAKHYVEKAAAVFIINVPLAFAAVWAALKRFIDPVTLNKVRVFRSQQLATKALLEQIDSDQLPACLGGTSKVPLGHSPEEALLRDLVRHLAAR